jgi:hypothetical protein
MFVCEYCGCRTAAASCSHHTSKNTSISCMRTHCHWLDLCCDCLTVSCQLASPSDRHELRSQGSSWRRLCAGRFEVG